MGSVQGTGSTPSSCYRAPFPSLAPKSLEGSHSKHSKMVEASAPGKWPRRVGQERSALFLSMTYEDPQPLPRSYFVQAPSSLFSTFASSFPPTQLS